MTSGRLIAIAAALALPAPAGCADSTVVIFNCDHDTDCHVGERCGPIHLCEPRPMPDLLPPPGLCADDPDCDASAPFCEPHSARCVECVPWRDACGAGRYCDPVRGFTCQRGCRDPSDCPVVGGTAPACCFNQCVDTARDPLDCGGCGNVCGPGVACLAGHCAPDHCRLGVTDCNRDPADGCETFTDGDVANCGGCGRPCGGATPACIGGRCAVGERVLVVAAVGDSLAALELVNRVGNMGAFSVVDLTLGTVETVSLERLRAHDAALVAGSLPLADAALMGDRLADYVDGGGRAVLCFLGGSVRIGGRFGAPGSPYLLVDGALPPGAPIGAIYLGAFGDPDSPLVTGIDRFAASSTQRDARAPRPGATGIAWWNDGGPLLVQGEVGGHRRVDVNLSPDFPPDDSIAPRYVDRLLRNALLFR